MSVRYAAADAMVVVMKWIENSWTLVILPVAAAAVAEFVREEREN